MLYERLYYGGKSLTRDQNKRLKMPTCWWRADILAASLGINLLALALPIIVLQAYDRIIPNTALDTFVIMIIGVSVCILLEMVLRIARSLVLAKWGARFEHEANLSAFRHLMAVDTRSFNKQSKGFFLSRMQAIEDLQRFYSGQSMLLMLDLPFALLFLALMWYMCGLLVLIPIVLLVVFALVAWQVGSRLSAATDEAHQQDQHRQNFLIETLGQLQTIKAMAIERFMMRRYERLQAHSAEKIAELAKLNSVVQGLSGSLSQIAIVLVVAAGSLSVISGDMSVGALAAATMLTGRALQPGLKAMGLWTQLQTIKQSRIEAEELLALPEETYGTQAPEELAGSMALEEVSYRFDERSPVVLDKISLSIAAGEAIAITGENGSGKSTLLNLLNGLLVPTSGMVSLDEKPVADYDADYLRYHIGYAPQSGVLYEGTILENMTLFRHGEVIEQALTLAKNLGLDGVIARLPEGFDTRVGGATVERLSAAIKQQILMIRALVGNPRVMLLDDTNACFDLKSDAMLLNLLKRVKGARTLVIITSRPSFMRFCDRAFELNNGHLNELTRPSPRQSQPSSPKPSSPESKAAPQPNDAVPKPSSENPPQHNLVVNKETDA